MTVQFHLLVMNFIFPSFRVFRKFRIIKIAEDFENLYENLKIFEISKHFEL